MLDARGTVFGANERTRWIWFAGMIYLVNKLILFTTAAIATWHQLLGRTLVQHIAFWFLNCYYRWDAPWYGIIAHRGYYTDHGYYAAMIAFFPLLPMMMRALQVVSGMSLMVSGVLIGNVFFLFSLYWFAKLLRLDYDERDTRKILWLFVLYPTSYYFSAAYTESPYLLFTVLALYFARQRTWAGSATAGFFASAARNMGVFLSVPFALEFFNIERWHDLVRRLPERLRSLRKSDARFLWVLLIPASLFVYMAFLGIKFHDPFAFSGSEKRFGRHFMFPLLTLIHGYISFGSAVIHLRFTPYQFLEFFAVTLTVVILLLFVRRMRLSYWILTLYSFLIPISVPLLGTHMQDYFVSYSRYSAVIFPLFIGLYELVKKRRAAYITALVVLLLLLLSASYCWARDWWVA